jgi:hypothetical protein
MLPDYDEHDQRERICEPIPLANDSVRGHVVGRLVWPLPEPDQEEQ